MTNKKCGVPLVDFSAINPIQIELKDLVEAGSKYTELLLNKLSILKDLGIDLATPYEASSLKFAVYKYQANKGLLYQHLLHLNKYEVEVLNAQGWQILNARQAD